MDVATVAPAVWSHAVRVFGSEQKASRWMETRLSELNDRTPEEVLSHNPSELGQICYAAVRIFARLH
jgi:uncharacterized protein (DUF2384 family)